MLPASFIQAYKSWVSDNEKEGQLPDLNLSVDQLFFIGFATVSYVHIEHYLETTMYFLGSLYPQNLLHSLQPL